LVTTTKTARTWDSIRRRRPGDRDRCRKPKMPRSWRTHDSAGCTIATSWRRSALDRDNASGRAQAPDRFARARIPCHVAVDVDAPNGAHRRLRGRCLLEASALDSMHFGEGQDVFWSGDPVRPFLLIKRGLISASSYFVSFRRS
jgi:hypothetical protein